MVLQVESRPPLRRCKPDSPSTIRLKKKSRFAGRLKLRSPQDFHEHVSCHRERAGNDARPENSFVANKIAIRSLPRLVCLLSVIILCLQAIPLRAADSRHLATVPALGVLAGGQLGTIYTTWFPNRYRLSTNGTNRSIQ